MHLLGTTEGTTLFRNGNKLCTSSTHLIYAQRVWLYTVLDATLFYFYFFPKQHKLFDSGNAYFFQNSTYFLISGNAY